MGELTVRKDSGLVELLHKENQIGELEKPFERDIMLFDTVVAGTSHVPGIEEILAGLQEGDRLTFLREPDNNYDEKAIAVLTSGESKIGYVPRYDNVVFSRLMDAGKLLFGKVVHIDRRKGWTRIRMEIYLHE